jgi:hypothetical protein
VVEAEEEEERGRVEGKEDREDEDDEDDNDEQEEDEDKAAVTLDLTWMLLGFFEVVLVVIVRLLLPDVGRRNAKGAVVGGGII